MPQYADKIILTMSNRRLRRRDPKRCLPQDTGSQSKRSCMVHKLLYDGGTGGAAPVPVPAIWALGGGGMNKGI